MGSTQDLISVVVPIYNMEHFLSGCVQSLLAQTYRNLEIILVDDGSTDESLRICRELAEVDERIVVIHQENKGVSGARNTGISRANGQYIGFVDPDDSIHEQMYEILYNNMIYSDADISAAQYMDVHVPGIITGRAVANHLIAVYDNLGALKSIYDENPLLNSGLVCNKLFIKKLFDNIQFPVGKRHEDDAVIYLLYDCAEKIVYSDAVVYYYYKRPGSFMQTYSSGRLDIVDVYAQRVDYFKSKDYKELAMMAFYDCLRVIQYEYISLSRSGENCYNEKKDLRELYKELYKNNEVPLSFRKVINKIFYYQPILFLVIRKLLKQLGHWKYK